MGVIRLSAFDNFEFDNRDHHFWYTLAQDFPKVYHTYGVSVCPSGTGLGMYIMYIMYTIYICIGYMPQHTPKYGGYLIRFWQFWIWQPESSFLIYSCPGLSENIPHLWCFLNFWKTQHTPKYGGYLIRFWQFWIWQLESSFLIYSHPGLSENIPHLWCFLNFFGKHNIPQNMGVTLSAFDNLEFDNLYHANTTTK